VDEELQLGLGPGVLNGEGVAGEWRCKLAVLTGSSA
jgi:hypothetical protein